MTDFSHGHPLVSGSASRGAVPRVYAGGARARAGPSLRRFRGSTGGTLTIWRHARGNRPPLASQDIGSRAAFSIAGHGSPIHRSHADVHDRVLLRLMDAVPHPAEP